MNEVYDDIEKLLSHEALGAFEYQTFKKAPIVAPEPREAIASEPPPPKVVPIEQAAANKVPEGVRPESRQLRLVTSKAQLATAHLDLVPVKAPPPGIVSVFQRLTRAIPAVTTPTVVLDLHLPERPMIAPNSTGTPSINDLPIKDGFARLLRRVTSVSALSA